MRWRAMWGVAIWVGVVCGLAPRAAAQTPPVRAGAMDLAIGVTANSLFQDVNSAPACRDLNFPCTHEHPAKLNGLSQAGIDVSVRVPLQGPINSDNRRYLTAKATRAGHKLDHLLGAVAEASESPRKS